MDVQILLTAFEIGAKSFSLLRRDKYEKLNQLRHSKLDKTNRSEKKCELFSILILLF